MVTHPNCPRLESHLPDLMVLVTTLAQAFESGEIDSWQVMADRVQAFFTPEMMTKVDAVVPGWRKMSSYANGVTLVHVLSVFTALLLCPEYRNATAEQRCLMEWIVLCHDLAKKVQPGRGDHIHGFRSAAMTAQILPRLGFAVADEYELFIKAWTALTKTAIIKPDQAQDYIPNNRKLPEILDGIDMMFGRNAPAALVVKAVLFHLSINVVKDWPQAAPLAEVEIRQYVGAELLPLLEVMMLVDNDAWNLFNQGTRERYRQEILATFRAVRSIIAASM